MPKNKNVSLEIENLLIENSKNSYYKFDYNKIYSKINYAKNQKFLNIPALKIREIGKNFYDLPYRELEKLIKSNINEKKFLCLVILVKNYNKNINFQREIFDFYIKNIDYIDFWNLIDISADKIIGAFLFDNREYLPILDELSNSKNFWHKRIAILATWFFIKKDDFSLTLNLCKKFLNNEHDLIYKACGWMLREVGKRNQTKLIEFLNKNYHSMPSIMKSYATEKLTKDMKNNLNKLDK